jgi:aromatic ring-opening dioxygenase catalytic subunit (LigB family)
LGEPAAILVISAHWEEDQATVTSGNRPELIYDYYGFPPQAYDITYPAPGNPELARDVLAMLERGGVAARLDGGRGFDHGLFVPLRLMYPDAAIPCIQLSLLSNLDAAAHLALGSALSDLRQRDLLIIGSGMSFHNMRAFSSNEAGAEPHNQAFDHWLVETCTDATVSPDQRRRRLAEWIQAPGARYCHPREEHLLPLQVCYGIASAASPLAEVVFNGRVLGRKVSALLWQ